MRLDIHHHVHFDEESPSPVSDRLDTVIHLLREILSVLRPRHEPAVSLNLTASTPREQK